MSFVWVQNDHVKDYFFHRGKLWSMAPSALVPGEVRTLREAVGKLSGLEGIPQNVYPRQSIGKLKENKPKRIVKSMIFQNHVKSHRFSL